MSTESRAGLSAGAMILIVSIALTICFGGSKFLLLWLGVRSILGIETNVFLLSVWLACLAFLVLLWLRTWPEAQMKSIRYDFWKDSALAFLTAVLVTAIYGSVLEFRRVSDLFSLFIGSEVRPEVLAVATTEIFKRDLIRDNTDIRFTVTRDRTLPPYQALLTTEVAYDVYSLKPEGDRYYKYPVSLDDTLKGKDENGGELPRFDEVSIGNRVLKGAELNNLIIAHGEFKDDKVTPLNPWPQKDGDGGQKTGVRIRNVRTEIIYIPDTYTLTLGELTKSIRVHVQTEDGIEHKFKSWFQRNGDDFEPEGNEQYFEGIALPGQSISIQFFNKQEQTAAPPKSLAAPPAQTKGNGH
jgi:hypothetical protein